GAADFEDGEGEDAGADRLVGGVRGAAFRIEDRHVNDFTGHTAEAKVAEVSDRVDGDAGDRYLVVRAIAGHAGVGGDDEAAGARRAAVDDGQYIGLEDHVDQRRTDRVKPKPQVAQRVTVVVGVEQVAVGNGVLGDGSTR